jgi:ATP-dependent DNA helicase RecG
VLLYQAPLNEVGRERLEVMRRTNDGFEVAQKDLELRGPGEVLGTRQTGLLQLRVADLLRDADLAPEAQRIGRELLARSPEVVEPLIRRWVGDAARYGTV